MDVAEENNIESAPKENKNDSASGDIIAFCCGVFAVPGSSFAFSVRTEIHGVGNVFNFRKAAHKKRNKHYDILLEFFGKRSFFKFNAAHHHGVFDVGKISCDIGNGSESKGNDGADFIGHFDAVKSRGKLRRSYGKNKQHCGRKRSNSFKEHCPGVPKKFPAEIKSSVCR